MLSEEELNLLADIFAERFENVNARILLDMAETLKKTEDLIPAYSKKLQQMYTFGYDVDLITQQLARESGKSIEEVEKLYEAVAQEGLDWTKPFYEAKGIKQIPLSENKVLQNIIQSAAAVTKDTLRNISNTTTVGIRTGKGFEPLGSFYKKTVDQAVTAVATGTEDYKKVIRQAVKDMGSSGLRVRYVSGYTKRLDSAIRQNILDGVSYIVQETAHATGKEFGADGVEISAHSPCAPDHIPYQGNQYSNKEFQELQQRLTRPIGEWNCRHIAYPILLGVSHPANSKAELKEMKRYSNEKIMIDGDEYTRYECTQLQRKMETKLRYAREEKQLYQAIEDKHLVRSATEKIRLLSNKYVEVSEKAGLPTKAERTRIVSSKLRGRGVVSRGKNDIIKLSIDDENRIMKYDFSEVEKYKGKMTDRAVRKWYKYHDEQIPNMIDRSKSIEEQARQACELRNKHRTQARDLMRDQDERRRLDIERPNKTFDELLSYKMNAKGMARDEAVKDIFITATKTNREVNKSLGLE